MPEHSNQSVKIAAAVWSEVTLRVMPPFDSIGLILEPLRSDSAIVEFRVSQDSYSSHVRNPHAPIVRVIVYVFVTKRSHPRTTNGTVAGV